MSGEFLGRRADLYAHCGIPSGFWGSAAGDLGATCGPIPPFQPNAGKEAPWFAWVGAGGPGVPRHALREEAHRFAC